MPSASVVLESNLGLENLSCPLPLVGLVFGMLGSQRKDAAGLWKKESVDEKNCCLSWLLERKSRAQAARVLSEESEGRGIECIIRSIIRNKEIESIRIRNKKLSL